MSVTRRQIQVGLGLLWLLDAGLQLQPFMFGEGFAHDVIAPAAQGQPGFVSSGVGWAAALIGAHPAVWNTWFAVVQTAIGVGLLVRRTVRPALVVSFGWALGVWYFGEGLGGLASGHADLLTGAPGAVLLYVVLGSAAWPSSRTGRHPPAPWLPAAWAVLWVGAALLRVLPGQNTAAALADEVSGGADGAPGWLAHLDHVTGPALAGGGVALIAAVAAVEAAIGIAGLFPGPARSAAGAAGIVVSLVFWVLGQSVGELYTGQATDPNSAPLVVFLAIALLSLPGDGVQKSVDAVDRPPREEPRTPA